MGGELRYQGIARCFGAFKLAMYKNMDFGRSLMGNLCIMTALVTYIKVQERK